MVVLCRIPEECPQGAWRLYWRCVDLDPAKRPFSSELVEHLRELQLHPAPTLLPKPDKDISHALEEVEGNTHAAADSTPDQQTPGEEDEKQENMVSGGGSCS
jgi:hypothetical protein